MIGALIAENGSPAGGPVTHFTQIATQTSNVFLPVLTDTTVLNQSVDIPPGGLVEIDLSLEIQASFNADNVTVKIFIDGVQDTQNQPFGNSGLYNIPSGFAALVQYDTFIAGLSLGNHVLAVVMHPLLSGDTIYQGTACVKVYST